MNIFLYPFSGSVLSCFYSIEVNTKTINSLGLQTGFLTITGSGFLKGHSVKCEESKQYGENTATEDLTLREKKLL